MEKETKLVPYEVEYICDKCGEGSMMSTGIMKTASPPLWVHTCPNFCGNSQDFKEQYPTIRYKKEEIEK